ncbi:hypothetical protein [Brunnivagina elsteri]|uniref:Glycerophosphoryl diester phosphodiesterase membrane domain-containing protein n=1 Tax=Brunnivagina elsteri CCALA 953 TaxID=987040 RepID=A0A2A2TCX7_9CYAN|nr:hypothetical protein [Calothrix elsteri]PAX51582.1 hypothetical protein CK510_24035 [Calothrix elsteri CCALA 953]
MDKIKEAIKIYAANFTLFILIVLSVRFPVNILTEIIVSNLPKSTDVLIQTANEIRANNLLSAIFDPIYVSAIVYCVWQIKRGGAFNYNNAMSVGIQNWGKLFTVNLVAGIFIILGFIAFIIPGILLAMRYSLSTSIVIVEGSGNSSVVLKRSAELTEGRRGEIAWVTFLLTILLFVLAFIIAIPFTFSDSIISNVISASIIDLILPIFPITLFLFYWQAQQKQDTL